MKRLIILLVLAAFIATPAMAASGLLVANGTLNTPSSGIWVRNQTIPLVTPDVICAAYDMVPMYPPSHAGYYRPAIVWSEFPYTNTSNAQELWYEVDTSFAGPFPTEWNISTQVDKKYIAVGQSALCESNTNFVIALHRYYNDSSYTPPPTANFTAAPTSGAAPLYVMLDDTSENETVGCTYNWSITPASGISAGATSTLENHAASFSVNGSYTVSHGVSCPSGSDIEEKTDYITVYNATTDYITTHFVVMDEPRWVQLAGSTINMLDIENGTWKNVSPSTTGYEGITTLSNHTISAFASMAGYGDDELLAQPAWSGGDYRLLLFPDNYGNVSAGNVTVYVTVYDADAGGVNADRLAAAAVNMAYSSGGDQVNDYRTTDSAGMVSFVVPNNTVIYLYAEKAGYTRGGTTINSGTGSGGSAAVYAEITLQRTTVTTAPTVTTLPGGGTPAPTVDPYPCDADHPENCKRKQTEMGNTLIQWGPDLLLLFICATIIGTIKLMMK